MGIAAITVGIVIAIPFTIIDIRWIPGRGLVWGRVGFFGSIFARSWRSILLGRKRLKR